MASLLTAGLAVGVCQWLSPCGTVSPMSDPVACRTHLATHSVAAGVGIWRLGCTGDALPLVGLLGQCQHTGSS